MISSISFGSMFNPEKISGNGIFNPEHDIEELKNDVERPKDFPAFPDESIGRSQIKTSRKLPHKLELSGEDKDFLSKLSTDMYGFHGTGNKFWVHSKKPGKANVPNMIMGDGKLKDKSRHDFIKELINDETQAFQIAGNDKFGGNKLITVVKNNETNTLTMYTCDSKQCYPMNLDSDVDIKKLASAITDNLVVVHGATVWKQ